MSTSYFVCVGPLIKIQCGVSYIESHVRMCDNNHDNSNNEHLFCCRCGTRIHERPTSKQQRLSFYELSTPIPIDFFHINHDDSSTHKEEVYDIFGINDVTKMFDVRYDQEIWDTITPIDIQLNWKEKYHSGINQLQMMLGGNTVELVDGFYVFVN